jgi:SagB-type dehydrogenase family enzyme
MTAGASTDLSGLQAVLRLRRDVTVSEVPDGDALQISSAGGSGTLRGLPAGVRDALRALARGDTSELELAALVAAGDGEMGVVRLHMLLRRLDAGGLIEHAVRVESTALARLRCVGHGPVTRCAPLRPAVPVKLSRFATIRADGGGLVAQSPRSHLAVELEPPAAAILGAAAQWATPAEVAARACGIAEPTVRAVLQLLADAGLLVSGGAGHDAETAEQSLAQWSVHDLWLHARSRGPRLSARYGGTYALAELFPPLPAVAPAAAGRRVTLTRPDLAAVAASDPCLTDVLESRRSIREHHSGAPITAQQLGEMLYRSMRLRRTFSGHSGQDDDRPSDAQELSDRPYPSGGAVHELEVYPVVSSCAGLEAGIWHYATADHAFEFVAEPSPAMLALVQGARAASLMRADPQVLLVVSARFGRVMWKYDAIGYSLVLKHVGVLYQTMYLVGTAMGLAVCGIGGGDAGDFASATGLDYHAEGSVGELVVGSRPAALSSDPWPAAAAR